MMSAKSTAAFSSKDSHGNDDDDDSSFAFNARVPIHRDSVVGANPGVGSALSRNGTSAQPASPGTKRGKPGEVLKAPPLGLLRSSKPKLTDKPGANGDSNGNGGERKGSQGPVHATLQRLGSIRGDLNALLTAFDPQLAAGSGSNQQHQSSSNHSAPASLELPDNLDARLCCARSLYKLSCEHGGEAAIVNGGAIAQIADFSDIDDPRLLRYAAATLANLTAIDNLAVLEQFVKLDGASALLELSWTPCIDVKLLCTTALCRLTQHAVFAALLVRARAMNELSAMLAIPHPRLQLLVVSCILNLVHHGTVLPDKVFLGDPHALQNPLGVLSVVSQQAAVPASSAFAAEVLFNMSVNRSGCSCALRGGGAEILHALAVQVTKAVDALAPNVSGGAMRTHAGRSKGTESDGSHTAPVAPWMANREALLKLLRLMAATLANFSAMSEYHALLNGYGMKTLALLLFAPLRELRIGANRSSSAKGKTQRLGGLHGDASASGSSSGDWSSGDEDEEWNDDSADDAPGGRVRPERRLRAVAVSCSRALANFASNGDFRRHAFLEDVVHVVVRLTLVDHRVLPHATASSTMSSPNEDSECAPRRAFARNVVRVLTNLSFEETCSAYLMEFPHVLQLLHAIAVHPSLGCTSEAAAYSASTASSTHQFRFWLTNDVVCEDMKEDALVTILNLASQAVYAGPLLRTLDGRKLAQAAEKPSGHSPRLRYVYALVLSNLLFQSHLQQSVFGDQAVTALVSGFHFAPRPDADLNIECTRSLDRDGDNDPANPNSDSNAMAHLRSLHIARDDDRERFLAAIFVVASELMGASNIECVVRLVAECLQTHVDTIAKARAPPPAASGTAASRAAALAASGPPSATPQQLRSLLMRQHPITCFAAAALHSMARSATQRGEKRSVVFSDDMVSLLIRICAATPKGSLQSSLGAVSSTSTGLPGSVPGGAGSANGLATQPPSSAAGVTPLPNYCGIAQAFCASTLYHLCVSAGGGAGVDTRVVQGLIDCCNEHEETQSLLACSASFAIISFCQDGCRLLTQCHGLARALNRLGRSSHVETQLYAAITACNVSALQCVWASTELRDFIVVALLRANSVQAKRIHAKTLSNLLSHVQIRPQIIEDGVLYALMRLSQVLLTSGGSIEGSKGGGGAGPPKEATTELNHSSSVAAGASSPTSAFMLTSTLTPSAPATVELLSIGLQALYNLSCSREYHPKLLSNGVMAYLSTVVAARQQSQHVQSQSQLATESLLVSPSIAAASSSPSLSPQKNRGGDNKTPIKTTGSSTSPSRGGGQAASSMASEDVVAHLSLESRRSVLGIICNLASFEENHQELMHAHVSAIIRKCVDPRDVEARASASMALRNLSCRMPWVEMLCERKTLMLLLALAQPGNAQLGGGHAVVRHYATQAVANCSLVTDSLHLFAELKVPRAVLSLLDTATIDQPASQDAAGSSAGTTNPTATDTYMAALKCIHNAALDDALALQLVDECFVLRLVPLLEYRSIGVNEEACELVATTVKTLAGKARCAEALLKQRTVGLCALLHRKHPDSAHIANECVSILMTLSMCQQIQAALAETQAIHVIVSICSSPLAQVHARMREFGAIAIRNLTLSAMEHLALFYGDTALEAEEEISMPAPEGEDGAADACSSHSPLTRLRSKRQSDLGKRNSIDRSPSPNRRQSAGFDEYEDSVFDDEHRLIGGSGRANVSRLAERHLLYGLKYFQQEIESGNASARVLLEACAALANMSTVRAFRPAMTRAGVVSTLLTVHAIEPPRVREVFMSADGNQHALMKRICAATLHRLVVEDGCTNSMSASDRQALVPSLLAVVRLTDEELHQVRYECEKVSVYAPQAQNAHARRFSLIQAAQADTSRAKSGVEDVSGAGKAGAVEAEARVGRRRSGFIGSAGGAAGGGASNVFIPSIMVSAATQCVKQSFREPKWMVYVIKTSLSSQSMVPQLDKKQLRTIGQPRLSFQETIGTNGGPYTTAHAASPSSSPPNASLAAPPETELGSGYLLNVAKDKYLVVRDREGNELVVLASGNSSAIASSPSRVSGRSLGQRTGSIDLSAVTADGDFSGQDAGDLDSIIHQRKFDQHMRLSRRNLRRNIGGSGGGSGGSGSSAPLPPVLPS